MSLIILFLVLLVLIVYIILTSKHPEVEGIKKYDIRNSKIHGKGVFAINDIEPSAIHEGIVFKWGIPQVTKFGSMINHSYKPNTHLEKINGKYYLVNNKKINKGDEITVDYSNTPWYIQRPNPKWKS